MAWLAEFSAQVRQSTLKRLAQVRSADRTWSPGTGILSFADTLAHLIEVDRWLLDRLAGKDVPDVDPHPGAGEGMDWDKALAEFEDLGRRRQDRMSRFSQRDLAAGAVEGGPGEAPTPLWHLLLRRGLDHEIHHRGELQLMLMLRE